MAIFMTFIWVGAQWPSLYAPSYVARTVLVGIALWVFWPQYTKVRWNHWWLGVIVGVVGIFQWVPMQLWLQHLTQGTFVHRLFKPADDPFNPFNAFASPTVIYGFIAIRIIGATLVVPVMEELFWRDWLWRTILAPNDFKLAEVGERDWTAYLIVSGAFALVHGNWWLTAIVWALLVGALLIYTRSLGACIIAHGVTNLLLAGYVLYTRDWSFW
jgi:CAAX prenyl protease-like protein